MANVCCDDVYFYSDQYPERLQPLWNDLKTSILLPSQSPDNCWIGNLFQYKKIPSENLSLRGSVYNMDYDGSSIFLTLETCWSPLYEAYQRIADAYGVSFVMRGIEPGCEVYYNTDEEKRYFYDQYVVRIEDSEMITPSGKPLANFLESDELFSSDNAILERFETAGYSANSLAELTALLQDSGVSIYEFQNPYK